MRDLQRAFDVALPAILKCGLSSVVSEFLTLLVCVVTLLFFLEKRLIQTGVLKGEIKTVT